MMHFEYITKESIDKFQNLADKKPYFSSKAFEEEVGKELFEILRNDKKFQEFSKQRFNDIIIGKEKKMQEN